MESNKFEFHSVNTTGPWSIDLESFKKIIYENQETGEFYFDDGLKSAYTFAAPHLDSLGLHGIFGIISSLVGTEGYMTWDQICDLRDRGHIIANHTHTHQRLDHLTFISWIINEIIECQQEIMKHTNIIPYLFIPPYNAFDQRVEEAVDKVGLELVKNRIPTHEIGTVRTEQ